MFVVGGEGRSALAPRLSGDVVVRSVRVAGRTWVNVRRRLAQPTRRRDVAVRIDGDNWLGELLAPSAVVLRGHRRSAVPVIELGEADLAPFVQPVHANPVKQRWPDDAPHEFKQRSSDASLARSRPDPGARQGPDLASWLSETFADHPAYRRAHAVTADDVIEAEMRRLGLAVGPVRRDVTVVCVTMRPEHVRDVIGNYDRQVGVDKRLIVITNADGFEHTKLTELIADRLDITVLRTDPSVSLGECLNLGVDLADTRYLAKFDDDDRYGAHYLHDLLLAHRYANAAVVGKHSYFGYLGHDDTTVLRFPGREFVYTPFLAGGSLVIDLDRTQGIRFPHVCIGEDQGFIAACHRRGLSTFAADRFNFLQVRNGDNTWNPPLEHYLSKSAHVGDGRRDDLVDV